MLQIVLTLILYLLLLIPVGIGILGGILGGSKLIDWLLKRFPRATYWAIFGFVIGSIPSIFQKTLLLTLNKGCRLAGCFSKFPAKIFLPSLTLNKGRRLWGCFREQFEILSKKGFSAQISKLSGETFHF